MFSVDDVFGVDTSHRAQEPQDKTRLTVIAALIWVQYAVCAQVQCVRVESSWVQCVWVCVGWGVYVCSVYGCSVHGWCVGCSRCTGAHGNATTPTDRSSSKSSTIDRSLAIIDSTRLHENKPTKQQTAGSSKWQQAASGSRQQQTVAECTLVSYSCMHTCTTFAPYFHHTYIHLHKQTQARAHSHTHPPTHTPTHTYTHVLMMV